jgi:hypothetical protein
MARPAPNAPRGGNYDDDGEAEDDRPVTRPGKRMPPRQAEQRPSQPQRRHQPEAREPSEPDEAPWQDLNEPVAKDKAQISLGEEESLSTAGDQRHALEPEEKSPARRAARDEQAAAVPLPEPAYPPPLVEDATWEAIETPSELKDEAAAKPAKERNQRRVDVAGTIYLILLALVAASLSAAVVLFLF